MFILNYAKLSTHIPYNLLGKGGGGGGEKKFFFNKNGGKAIN